MGVWGVWSAPGATLTLSRKLSCLMSNPHPHKIQMISMNKECKIAGETCKHLPSFLTKLRLKDFACTDPGVSCHPQSPMMQAACLAAFQRSVREAIRSGNSLSISASGLTEDKRTLQSAPSLRPSGKQLGTPQGTCKREFRGKGPSQND